MNIQNLVLDINKKCNQLVTANVGEVNSRILKISVIDNGVPMDLTGITVYLYAKKADGTKVFNTVKVEDAKQGIVSAEITSQVLAIEGFVKLTLLLTKDKARLASKIFTLKVDETIVDDEAIESSNEFTALTDALSGINNIDSKFEKVTLQLAQKANLNSIFSMANMGQDIKEAMTGGSVAVVGRNSILSDNIVDEQIGIEKTNFIKVNQLECDRIDVGKFINTNGTLNAGENNATVLVYNVKPNTKYKIKVTNNDRFRICCHNQELPLNTNPLQVVVIDDTKTEIEFVTNSGVNYLYAYISQNNIENTTYKVYDFGGELEINIPIKPHFIDGINKLNFKDKYTSVSIIGDNIVKTSEKVFNTYNFIVKPNTDYRVIIKGEWNRFRIGGFKEEIDILTSAQEVPFDKTIMNNDTGYYDNIIFNSGECTDIWIYTSNNSQLSEIVLYEENPLQIYDMKIADYKFLEKYTSDNFLNKTCVEGLGEIAGYINNYKNIGLIGNNDGTLTLQTVGVANSVNTYNFVVKPNTDYRVIIKGEWNRFRIGGFKEHRDVSSIGPNKFIVDETIMNNDTGYYDNIIFNSGECTDIWIYTSNNFQHSEVEVYEYCPLKLYNRELTEYREYKKNIDDIKSKIGESKYKFFSKPEGFFNFKEIPEFDNKLNSTSYYELFDVLNYSSKEVLGYESVENLPINKYVFEPTFVDCSRDVSVKVDFKVPTVLITSTIHGGDEKLTCWVVYHFFKMLETTTDENLLWLRNHVRFIVVPMINPWGFDNGVRANGNGYDLNREFLKSEGEMQEEARLLKQLADNTEYDILVDLHTMWAGKGKHTTWIISSDDSVLSFDNNLILYLSREWKKRYSFMEQDNTIFGYVGQPEYIEPSLQDSQFRNYSYNKGVKYSSTLEIANTVTYNNEVRYGQLTSNLYFDLFVNYILGIVRVVL